MSTANFADLANVKVGSVEPPKSLPGGHYLAKITGPMTQHKAKSGNVAMRFPCQILGPGEDVDQEEFAAASTGQDGKAKDLKFNMDFWCSPDALFRFTNFVKSMGGSDDLGLIDAAEWLVGDGNKPFLVENKPQQSDDNPELFYNRFDNPTAAE